MVEVSRELMKAANNPQYQQRFDRTGADAVAQSPQDFAATIAADFKLMQELTARLKLKAP